MSRFFELIMILSLLASVYTFFTSLTSNSAIHEIEAIFLFFIFIVSMFFVKSTYNSNKILEEIYKINERINKATSKSSDQ